MLVLRRVRPRISIVLGLALMLVPVSIVLALVLGTFRSL